MRRGDVVTVATAGDIGKPRPAVIVQTDSLPPAHGSVVLCQLTSDISGASDFRVAITPSATNGLRMPSEVMADKPTTVRRRRIGDVIGALTAADMARLNAALALVLGLAD